MTTHQISGAVRLLLISIVLFYANLCGAQQSGTFTRIRLLGNKTDPTNVFTIQAPALTRTRSWTVPNVDGSSGYVLSTNGSGILSWVDPATLLTAAVIISPTTNGRNRILPPSDITPFWIQEVAGTPTSVKFGIYDNSLSPLMQVYANGLIYSADEITGLSLQDRGISASQAIFTDGTGILQGLALASSRFPVSTGSTVISGSLVQGTGITIGYSSGAFTISGSSSYLWPGTTLGDLPYENATPAPARLPGNITTTNKFLAQVGNGTISAAPGWNTITISDLPTLPIDSADYILNQNNKLQTGKARFNGSLYVGANDTVGGSQFVLTNESVSGTLNVGSGNTVSGTNSCALGNGNTSSGSYSYAIGGSNTSSGNNAFSAGALLIASGSGAVALGVLATANGDNSFAWGGGGNQSSANGKTNSVVFGDGSTGTTVDANNQFMSRFSGGYKLYDDATSTPAVTIASNTLTITKNGIASSPANGLLLQNTTAATSGNPQYSPAIDFFAGWFNSSAGTNDWRIYNATLGNAPDVTLNFDNNYSGSFVTVMKISSSQFGGGNYLRLPASGSYWLNGIRGNNQTSFTYGLDPQSGSNAAGNNVQLAASQSTGNVLGGTVEVMSTPKGATGSSVNALLDLATFAPSGTLGSNPIANFTIGKSSSITGAEIFANSTNNNTISIVQTTPSASRIDTLLTDLNGQIGSVSDNGDIGWAFITVGAFGGGTAVVTVSKTSNVAGATAFVTGGTCSAAGVVVLTVATAKYKTYGMVATAQPGVGPAYLFCMSDPPNLTVTTYDVTHSQLAQGAYSFSVKFEGQ
jgi:hypothetical protein